MDTYITQIHDVAEVIEFVPSSEHETVERVFTVPDGAIALLVGVGDVQGTRFTVPTNVDVRLSHETPEGEQQEIRDTRDTPDGSAVVREDHGLTSFVQNSPRPGRWKLSITTLGTGSFSVNVAIFRMPLQAMKTFATHHRCKACTVAVRTVLYTALAHLTMGAVAFFNLQGLAAAISTLPAAILQALGNVLGISTDTLRVVLQGASDVVGIVSPLDRLVRAICERLNLCSPQPALV